MCDVCCVRPLSAIQKGHGGLAFLADVLRCSMTYVGAIKCNNTQNGTPEMSAYAKETRSRFAKHMAYRRTLNELRALPLNIKLDLDISGIEAEVAKKAVYGA